MKYLFRFAFTLFFLAGMVIALVIYGVIAWILYPIWAFEFYKPSEKASFSPQKIIDSVLKDVDKILSGEYSYFDDSADPWQLAIEQQLSNYPSWYVSPNTFYPFDYPGSVYNQLNEAGQEYYKRRYCNWRKMYRLTVSESMEYTEAELHAGHYIIPPPTQKDENSSIR